MILNHISRRRMRSSISVLSSNSFRSFPRSRCLSAVESPIVKYAHLPSRSLIEVGPNGDDARSFLHGLVTADIKSLQHTASSHYTSFLNASGRVLDDVFIYPPPRIFEAGTGGLRGQDEPDNYLIEVDTSRANALIKHLRKHKLRRKLEFRLLNQKEAPVYSIWTDPPDVDAFTTLKPVIEPLRSWKLDQRPNMGARCILRPMAQMEEFFGPLAESFRDYTVHRMINGIAEGSAEIVPGAGLPQESNIDLFGGIDFRKGCYLGQELTIRTHHTGVVRKRILPVQLYEGSAPRPAALQNPTFDPSANFNLPPPGTDISSVSSRSGRSAGKWLGGMGNIGLALCRLESMTDIRLTDQAAPHNAEQEFKVVWKPDQDAAERREELGIRAFVPHWMRIGIENRLKGLRNGSG